MVIIGHGFSTLREQNKVQVGNERALVVGADRHSLVVITSFKAKDGPVVVRTPRGISEGRRPFKLSLWPPSGADGPPHSFEGVGSGDWSGLQPIAGSLTKPSLAVSPSALSRLLAQRTGTARVLVVCGHPTDRSPANESTALSVVSSKWEEVRQYNRQASYNQLDVDYEVVGYFSLVKDFAYYYKASPGPDGYPNFDKEKLPQILAEAAQYAVDQGQDLDNYQVISVSIYMDTFIRAWGGGSLNNPVDFKNDDLNIHSNLSHSLGTIVLGDNAAVSGPNNATSGRMAHEFGHNVVPTPLILEEDIYPKGNPGEDATAQRFDLMGDHDAMPLFSGYNMEGLGWYTTANIKRTVDWSRNPYKAEFEVVAHARSQNTNSSRCHLVKIHVSTGLDYYVEVRQTPGTLGSVFDAGIPLPSGKTGGVVITRSISGVVNNNQFTRAITLLQSQTIALSAGDTAVDPLRTIKITVIDDSVQASPLVCRVRIEWAQPTSPTPGGTSDLWITPWGPGYWTPDIWIDREGDGTFDHQDASGNPIEGGDIPQLGKIDYLEAKIRNQGSTDISNVVASFYVNTPPGIGDSGTWTPLKTVTVGSVPAGGSIIQQADWDPRVGDHTCVQVAIVPQAGESNVSNNQAQENIFTFLPAAHSVPEPVELPVLVRNPLDRRELISISIDGVPAGFYVYFPRRHLFLEPRSEARLELLVIPLKKIPDLKAQVANIRVLGYVPWFYQKVTATNGLPTASTVRSIGGIQARVAPRIGSQIKLKDPVLRDGRQFVAQGSVTPGERDQAVRVDCMRDDGRVIYSSPRSEKDGIFIASFILREFGLGAYLSFQAHIFNASVLAPCDSNIVHYKLDENDNEGDVPR